MVWFEGNYQEYDADRHRRLGAEADIPHRIAYRKLVRAWANGVSRRDAETREPGATYGLPRQALTIAGLET